MKHLSFCPVYNWKEEEKARPFSALFSIRSLAFLETDFPRLSLGNPRGSKKARQADNMPRLKETIRRRYGHEGV